MDISATSTGRNKRLHDENITAVSVIDEYIEKETALLHSDDDSPESVTVTVQHKPSKHENTTNQDKNAKNKNDEKCGKRVIEIDDEPLNVKKGDIEISNKLSSSYSKVVRKGGSLKLKRKDKASGEFKMCAVKKSIDKKSKNKHRRKNKDAQNTIKSASIKGVKTFDKYKTVEQLLDERVKTK
eukprot:CAMPEP_0202697754 /NCGR_PEP_ID=MMETSP1385-20130828/11064_1 /ASSEMBLY_ACC=CAM_ASM_000861 /TAXON_ID=933848 /ORGANISM="Elphidium margaritaceum" /LENGTH=182 /DNA_ID=CAMNT_0049354289 /DNA_START=23 /DNA_END=568 /DNA_ORIENTATION=-